MLLFILIQYDISMICYDTKDNLMAYAIALYYCSDLDDMSKVSFMCSSNTGGVLT